MACIITYLVRKGTRTTLPFLTTVLSGVDFQPWSIYYISRTAHLTSTAQILFQVDKMQKNSLKNRNLRAEKVPMSVCVTYSVRSGPLTKTNDVLKGPKVCNTFSQVNGFLLKNSTFSCSAVQQKRLSDSRKSSPPKTYSKWIQSLKL